MPRRIYHNCSGKHAAFLSACRAAGWPEATYLDQSHPLQQSVLDIVADATGVRPDPIWVDGCGAPTLAGTIRGLARGFARLSIDADHAQAASATSRFPSLVGDSTTPDGAFGAWWGGPVKGGAQGLLAASRNGIGIAVKSSAGSRTVAVMTMIAITTRLGLLSQAARTALDDVATPPVYGGGRRVGRMVSVLE